MRHEGGSWLVGDKQAARRLLVTSHDTIRDANQSLSARLIIYGTFPTSTIVVRCLYNCSPGIMFLNVIAGNELIICESRVVSSILTV